MKGKLTLGALLFGVTTAALVAQEGRPTGAKVYIEQGTFDFGFMPAGGVVTHSYFFYSRGTDSLRILEVKPGCGCTKVPLNKEVIAVGDSAEVGLIFTAYDYQRGPLSKTTLVTCNDANRKDFHITLKANIYGKPDSLTPLTLSPGSISFDPGTRSKEMVVTVRNVSPSPVSVKVVGYPYAVLKIDAPNAEIKPGKEGEIKVRIDPALQDAEFIKSFTFEVSDSAKTHYTIPVALSRVATQAPPTGKK